MKQPDLLTISQVSKLLGVHPDTIRRWEKSGKLSSIRFVERGHRRYQISEIMSLIKTNTKQVVDSSQALKKISVKNRFMHKGLDYPGVSIVYFCHDGQNNVLLNQRSQNCRDEHGRWDIGAGSLEFRDTVEATLKKEIKEEYCTDVLKYEFLGYRDLHRTHQGQKTHWVTLDFKVLIDKSKVKNGEPHKFDDVKWFKLGKLPQPLHSQLPIFLKKYSSHLP